jgi:bidirectional [NiFe] hydrogenase diaphorase subunit
MSVKTLKIDEIDVAIESGSTILQAAQAAGIEIPTLCYLKGVSAVGACRLCMVEIAGASKLFPACVT